MYNQGLFHNWVPKPIMLLFIILIALVFFGINGVYTTNITYMVGGTAGLTEDFLMANYVHVVGMAVSMSLYIRLKARFRTKEILVASLCAIGLTFVGMGSTLNPVLIIVGSFIVGFFKMLGMMEVLLPLMAILSADGNRGRFYSIFYIAVLIVTQVSGFHIAWLSYHYNWQLAYILLAALCLATALGCIVFQHNDRFMKKIPLHYVDVKSALLFVLSFFSLAYILAFGRQQDWFSSSTIVGAVIFFSVSFFVFVVRQQLIKRPLISFAAFQKNNVRHGMLLLLLMGMFLAAASIQNIFSVGILGYMPVVNASLNLMMIPGLVVSGIVGVKWFNRNLPIRMLLFSGFAAFTLYAITMYFSMVLTFNYESWLLPMFLKGYGTGVLFVTIWFYTLDKLDLTQLLSAIGIILLWRTFIAVGIFSALFSWLHYQLQQQMLGNLSVYVDGITLNQNLNISLNQGAILSKYSQLQVNSILAASKSLFGYMAITGILTLIYVFFHHFGKTRYKRLRVKVALSGKISIPKKDRSKIRALMQGEPSSAE
ncbi:hypothetical protein ACL9RF_04945 [Sphingobacterium sp. Mn56C]|uniref:hypothetical protein n=1 Tax=Sphingobacterium sp. Mn56C TaxID=3395261 RepID=UPI003BDC5BE9